MSFFTLANLGLSLSMRKTPCTNPYVSHFLQNPLPFLSFSLTHGASPLSILEFFFMHFFLHPVGCLLRSNCPTGRVVHPLKRPLPNVREGRGSWKKKIFHILFQKGGGGHLSYLDTGGPTRGTQLMNMFIVTKFVINDCSEGSITSFFVPPGLFTVLIVIYLFIFSLRRRDATL